MSPIREARALNLLLLLSALLSALTGIGAARGAGVPASAVCASASSVSPTCREARSIAHRPTAVLASIALLAAAPLAVMPAPRRVEPLFASRRRE